MPRELLTEAAAGFIFAAALYMCVTAVLGSGKPARIIPAAGLMGCAALYSAGLSHLAPDIAGPAGGGLFALCLLAGAAALEAGAVSGVCALSAGLAVCAWLAQEPLVKISERFLGMPSGVYSASFASVLFFCAAALAAVILRRLARSRKRVRVYIKTARGEARLTALRDSGNLLTEPVSGLPVIIARAEAVAEAAPPAVLYALGCEQVPGARDTPGAWAPGADGAKAEGADGAKAEGGEPQQERIYPIAYRSLGGSGALYGFEPRLCLVNGSRYRCVVALCRSASFAGCAAGAASIARRRILARTLAISSFMENGFVI